jgi:hypothetical protein
MDILINEINIIIHLYTIILMSHIAEEWKLVEMWNWFQIWDTCSQFQGILQFYDILYASFFVCNMVISCKKEKSDYALFIKQTACFFFLFMK